MMEHAVFPGRYGDPTSAPGARPCEFETSETTPRPTQLRMYDRQPRNNGCAHISILSCVATGETTDSESPRYCAPQNVSLVPVVVVSSHDS